MNPSYELTSGFCPVGVTGLEFESMVYEEARTNQCLMIAWGQSKKIQDAAQCRVVSR